MVAVLFILPPLYSLDRNDRTALPEEKFTVSKLAAGIVFEVNKWNGYYERLREKVGTRSTVENDCFQTREYEIACGHNMLLFQKRDTKNVSRKRSRV